MARRNQRKERNLLIFKELKQNNFLLFFYFFVPYFIHAIIINSQEIFKDLIYQ